MLYRTLTKYLSLVVGLAFLIGSAASQAADNHTLLATGGKGGWLNVTRPLTADDMQGRIMVLDFWTYGCINCMQVVPDLEFLEQKFGDKLLIVGVHSAKFEAEQGNERILAAAKRFGLKHPVINDSDYAIWKTFGVRAWPTMVVLAPDGKEIARFEGEGHRDELDDAITEALPDTDKKTTAISDILARRENTGILSFPARLAYKDGILYVADSGHNRILGFNADNKLVTTIGDGVADFDDGKFEKASFNHPRGIAFSGNTLYVADTGNHALRAVNLKTGKVSTVAGTGKQGRIRQAQRVNALDTPLASPWDIEPLQDGRIAIAIAGTHQLWVYDPAGKTVSVLAGTGGEAVDDGTADAATLAQPSGLSLNGDSLFFVDAESSALRELKDGTVTTLIGTGLFDFGLTDGTYPTAMLQHPQGLFADKTRIVIADTYNNTLRVYDRETKTLSTVKLPVGALNEPGDVIIVNGNALVADTNNHAIKSIDLKTGAITTLPLGK